MKKGIELYGIIIITVILLAMMLTYFFDKKGGFMGEITKTPPSSELSSADESGLLEGVADRKKPTLSATVRVLKMGKGYDLIKEFSITATNGEGKPLPVQIEEVTYEDGTVMDKTLFLPKQSGRYQVLCSAREGYQDFILETEETYEFVVD